MFNDKFRTFVNKYLDSPFNTVFSVVTILTTLWGVVSIYKDLEEWGGSQLAALIIAGILGLLVSFVLFSYFAPSMRRQYAIPTDARYIFTEINRMWEIDKAGHSMLTDNKTFLFFAEPQNIDLSDRPWASKTLSLKDIEYASTDSEPVDYEKISEYMQRIYWRPKKGSVKVGVPYTHNVSVKIPYKDEVFPKYKSMTVVIPVYTLRFIISIKSDAPVTDIVVFKENRFQKFRNADEIAKRGKSVKRTMAPLPTKLDKNNFSWSLENLSAGAVYYIILYYNYP